MINRNLILLPHVSQDYAKLSNYGASERARDAQITPGNPFLQIIKFLGNMREMESSRLASPQGQDGTLKLDGIGYLDPFRDEGRHVHACWR